MSKEIMYEQIYSDLLDKMKNEEYQPGSRLPSEMELAAEYGVSRITSKKALDMLAEKKYIIRSRGRGSFVNEHIKDILDPTVSLPEEKHPKKPLVGVIFDTFGCDFGSELLRNIELECRRNGFHMLFQCSYGSIEEENKAILSALQLGAEGLILMCAQGEAYNHNILRLALNKFPMVLVDREMKGISIPCVKTDNYTASKELTKLLIERGHKKICFVSHNFDALNVTARYNGYVDCIFEYEDVSGTYEHVKSFNPTPLDVEKEYSNFNRDEIREIIHRNREYTAFFTVEYKMALLFDKVLKEMGMEREVATFDSLPGILENTCHFVHVKQNESQMGMQAVHTLSAAIKGNPVEEVIHVPYEILIPNTNA